MSEIEFVNGLLVKAPHPKAPDYVKAKVSINRERLMAWLSERQDEWINIDVRAASTGKWYAAVDNWKPEKHQKLGENVPAKDYEPEFNDDCPF
ncbi:MAG: hypothetical protein ACYC9L_17460 [Sulfuricaulis sp.]